MRFYILFLRKSLKRIYTLYLLACTRFLHRVSSFLVILIFSTIFLRSDLSSSNVPRRFSENFAYYCSYYSVLSYCSLYSILTNLHELATHLCALFIILLYVNYYFISVGYHEIRCATTSIVLYLPCYDVAWIKLRFLYQC